MTIHHLPGFKFKGADLLVFVPASKLSENDMIFHYKPKTKEEREFKKQVIEVIKKGELKDFWHPCFDPSVSENDPDRICYEAGKLPAVDHIYEWWVEAANAFCPERNSRLGTKSEYLAFCACLIKQMIYDGWTLRNAWWTVCNDSRKIGHYWNSPASSRCLETTKYSQRYWCGFYDYANTYKILADDEQEDKFVLASGSYISGSQIKPLATCVSYFVKDFGYAEKNGTGWIVLD